MPSLPIIFTTSEDPKFVDELEGRIQSIDKSEFLLNYPVVYIHYWAVDQVTYQDRNHQTHSFTRYDVYIGESNNVVNRTRKHYTDGQDQNNWQYELCHRSNGTIPKFIVIGHKLFNKSFTLDLENRLIEYVMSAPRGLRKIHNGRGNPQNRYYPDSEFNAIFKKVWKALQLEEKDLFPPESVIFDSAIFKASPLKKLTSEQQEAKDKIINRVLSAIRSGKYGQLVFVQGEAGTGKTVLTTSTFYELIRQGQSINNGKPLDCHLMVNHDQQCRVYEQMAKRLDLGAEVVSKPTSFINRYTPDNKVDVSFIDEGHLLFTQGKQSYTGKNQLEDIIARSKVTVIMFDEYQVLTTEEYWEPSILEMFKSISEAQENYITLSHQFRMQCSDTTTEWLRRFVFDHAVDVFIHDEKGYDVKSFNTPSELYSAIKKKAELEESKLSRVVATYDWSYSNRQKDDGYWGVQIDDFFLPWNYELERTLGSKEKRHIRNLAWAEQPQTINEIGSTFTIQGFDLSYVGVILGPSVKYRNGQIIFDPSSSKNEKATRNRTLSSGEKRQFGETFIRNEVKVLLSRGVKGLYIYAVDEELRNALKIIAQI